LDRRKELKLQYKLSPRPMGVYQIRNMANGKIFVGSSQNMDGKFNSHRLGLKLGGHVNKALLADWKEFGEENFAFEVLERLEPAKEPGRNDAEELKKMETRWLEKLQPYGERGYNPKKRN
jgi:group I intron endonuclease